MLNWKPTEHGRDRGVTLEWLGLIPAFISPFSSDSAAEQIDNNYQHGGGWRPLKGWVMDPVTHVLTYPTSDEDGPQDPPLTPLFEATLRDELLLFYDSAWVAVVQPDGSFGVSRMD